MNLGALIATLGVNTAGLKLATADMQRFEARTNASVTRMNARLATTGAMMQKFGRKMSMAVTVPLLLAGGAAFKMYKDFESSMSKIVGLVGVAQHQVDEWGRAIIKMGPALGKAPTELADALFFITSAGIRGAEAMDVLEMSAKASASGLGETKVVADLVTSAMNAYGKETLNASMATDVLTATVREGKAQADLLAGSMGMVLPIASNMGVQFHEVGAAVAAMTRTGTGAQTASMQLRQILASLIKPSQQAEKAMWAMGTSSSALRKTIREDGLLTALMKIRELTNKYGEDTMAKVFPNIRALSGVLDIMGENLADNEEIFRSLSDAAGSTNTAFGAASRTVEFKLNQALTSLKTTLTVLGGTIAELLIPVFERWAERFQKLTMWFDNLSYAQKRLVVRLAGLLAAIGPIAIVLGFLATNVLPGLIKAFNRLWITMMKNPIIAIATALALITFGIIRYVNRLDAAAKAQKALEKITGKAIENTLKYKVAIEQLFRVAQDEKRTIEEREAALTELNKTSETYFGNLNLETINTEKATQAKQKYIAELLREAKVKAAQEALVALEKERLDLIISGEALRFKNLTLGQKLQIGLLMAVGNVAAANNAIFEAGGKNVDVFNEKYKATSKVLQDVIDELSKIEDFTGGGGGGTDNFTAQEQAIRDVDAAMKQLKEELQFARDMEEVFGDSFDQTTYMIKAQTEAIGQLLRAGVDPTSQGIKDLIEDIGLLEQTLGFNTEQLEIFARQERLVAEEMKVLDEAIAAQILAMHGLKEKSFNLGSVLENVFRGMSNVIADALNSTENTLQAFGKFFGDFIKGMIFRLIAATIAALALATVLTFIMPENISKVFKGLDSASKFGDVFKAGLTSFAGMADGGIVPPGYPNDSYPALLSSGEKVTPPKKLGGASTVIVNGVIEADMHKLRVALEQATEEHNFTT